MLEGKKLLIRFKGGDNFGKVLLLLGYNAFKRKVGVGLGWMKVIKGMQC